MRSPRHCGAASSAWTTAGTIRGGRQGLQPCTCGSAGRWPATSTTTARAWIPWDGGAVSDCGDAVNPSMGAWPRHPCRGHPALRHRPTSDRFLRLSVGVDLGRHFCRISKSIRGQIRFPPENGSDPQEPFQQTAGTCRRRGGSGCGGVSAMDGATEPPWTDSRRPPQPDPSRLPTGTPPLLVPLLLLLLLPPAGAGLQALPNAPPYFKRSSRLPPAHTTATQATPCHPHCASARLPSAPPAAIPMNMPVNSSALRRLRAGGTRP